MTAAGEGCGGDGDDDGGSRTRLGADDAEALRFDFLDGRREVSELRACAEELSSNPVSQTLLQ